MGIATFPTASGGTSSADWTYIATAAPSGSGNTVTFSGISGYKRLKVVGFLTQSAGSSTYKMQFNSDTTSGNYQSGSLGVSLYMSNTVAGGFTQNAIALGNSGVYSVAFSTEINNANLTTVYKDTQTLSSHTSGAPSYVNTGNGIWKSTAAITSITIITESNANNFAGNLYLMGQN
jgi:hypothetical protein